MDRCVCCKFTTGRSICRCNHYHAGFIGAFDPLTFLMSMNFIADLQWDICSCQSEIMDDRKLKFTPNSIGNSLADYDLIFVPGGIGTRSLQYDQAFISWLRSAEPTPIKASVCTGSLLLGTAGFLKGVSATIHPNAMEELKPYCKEVVSDRVVDNGNVITAGSVTASIDLGLHLVQRLTTRNPEPG